MHRDREALGAGSTAWRSTGIDRPRIDLPAQCGSKLRTLCLCSPRGALQSIGGSSASEKAKDAETDVETIVERTFINFPCPKTVLRLPIWCPSKSRKWWNAFYAGDYKFGPSVTVHAVATLITESHRRQALTKRNPPIRLNEGAAKHWWKHYRQGQSANGVTSAQELEDKYGAIVRRLAVENRTAHKLVSALKKLDTPLHVTEGIAKQWLLKYYGPLQHIESAGHLETKYGDKIRTHGPKDLASIDYTSTI